MQFYKTVFYDPNQENTGTLNFSVKKQKPPKKLTADIIEVLPIKRCIYKHTVHVYPSIIKVFVGEKYYKLCFYWSFVADSVQLGGVTVSQDLLTDLITERSFKQANVRRGTTEIRLLAAIEEMCVMQKLFTEKNFNLEFSYASCFI